MEPALRIYLDLHGVGFDFVTAAYAAHGREAPAGGPDRFNWFIEDWHMSVRDFWKPIQALGWRWWASLQPYPWLASLVESVTAYDPQYRALSAASDHGQAYAGTYTLARKALKLPASRIIITPAKHELAAPGRVLIDDHLDNCLKWIEAGGVAVLFPQPWSGGAVPNPVGFVKRCLADIAACEHEFPRLYDLAQSTYA